MIMYSFPFYLKSLFVSFLLIEVPSAAELENRKHGSMDIKDKIIELQCYAKCSVLAAEHRRCRDQCILDVMRCPRRGQCPNSNDIYFAENQPNENLICLNECIYDYDCPEVQKCCTSNCGPVCIDSIGVAEDPLLPPIPKIINYKLSRSHKVELTMESSANSTYYWHVEVRNHIGLLFSPRKLSIWQWQPVVKIAEISDARSKRTDIYFDLMPGRWYQVRVAAVNSYGFRGYSMPSKAFTLQHNPKPPKAPKDLKVISKHYNGKYISACIIWCPAKSNLPIEKYKVIWSLYVKIKDESIITNQVYVKDSLQYEITNLLPDASYFIQVQAISINGNKRLKSDKISVLFNSTIHTQNVYNVLQCSTDHIKKSYDHNIDSYAISKLNLLPSKVNQTLKQLDDGIKYNVSFFLSHKFGMITQISGFHIRKKKMYMLCVKDSKCEQYEISALPAKKDSLEFIKLKYNTTYLLKALILNPIDFESVDVFNFTTPECETLRRQLLHIKAKC